MSKTIAMYAGNPLLTDSQPLMNSGFNTLYLASAHLSPDNAIIWGDIPMIESTGQAQPAVSQLQSVLSDLKKSGGVSTALFSIGGGGAFPGNPIVNGEHAVSEVDYRNMSASIWSSTRVVSMTDTGSFDLFINLSSLLQRTGADGFDHDFESLFYSYEEMASTIAILTNWAQANGQVTTWVPYELSEQWAQINALTNSGALSWLNLQPPAYINNPTAASQAAAIESWATAFGIATTSIVAGFDSPMTAADIQSTLAGIVNAGCDLGGAYLFGFWFDTASEASSYATAMLDGLAGTAPSS